MALSALRSFAPLALRTLAIGLSLSAMGAPAMAQQAGKPPAAAPTSADKNGDKVLARVNGEAITQKDVDIAAADLGDRIARLPDDRKSEYLVGYLIDLRLGAKAARAAGADQTAQFKQELAYFSDKIVLDDYLTQEAKKAVTPEAAHKLYEDTLKKLKPKEEVRASHILVQTKDEAEKAYQRVTKGGEDFAKVAKEVSKDPGSAPKGGELGYFTKDKMVPEFADAAFKLKPGEISEPVKSQFGWHVIKLEDRRQTPPPSFDDVKEEINSYLFRKAQQDIILKLRATAKIERMDTPPAKSEPKSAPKADADGDKAGSTPKKP